VYSFLAQYLTGAVRIKKVFLIEPSFLKSIHDEKYKIECNFVISFDKIVSHSVLFVYIITLLLNAYVPHIS
jgi:hypothetical protein